MVYADMYRLQKHRNNAS